MSLQKCQYLILNELFHNGKVSFVVKDGLLDVSPAAQIFDYIWHLGCVIRSIQGGLPFNKDINGWACTYNWTSHDTLKIKGSDVWNPLLCPFIYARQPAPYAILFMKCGLLFNMPNIGLHRSCSILRGLISCLISHTLMDTEQRLIPSAQKETSPALQPLLPSASSRPSLRSSHVWHPLGRATLHESNWRSERLIRPSLVFIYMKGGLR